MPEACRIRDGWIPIERACCAAFSVPQMKYWSWRSIQK